MKKLILILLCTMFINSFLFPQQPPWQKQQSGTNANLHGLWFVDSANGWVCGDSGIILHTSNAGMYWYRQYSGVCLTLEDVFFLDSLNGWICGDSGTILSTIDGGLTWMKAVTTIQSRLHHIQFRTTEVGFASGERSTSLETSDSGKTWIVSPGSDSGSASIVFFWIDYGRGTFVRCDTLIHSQVYTVNAGRTWKPFVNLAQRINDICGFRAIYQPNYMKVFYFDVGEHGYVLWGYYMEDSLGPVSPALGQRGITNDTLNLSAVTWERNGTLPLRLWAVGEKGWIISSSDTGKTWDTSPSDVLTDLYEVNFLTHDHGWVVGDSGVILRYDYNTGVGDLDNIRFPIAFALSDPYPNPFNAISILQYRIPEKTYVQLTVYDILGREITTLVDENQQAGSYTVRFNAGGSPSGVYFARLCAGELISNKKLILIK